jgi:glycosyltransferase involved in cell wall biosynthesis
MKIAIVHDYLNQYGGAEKVIEVFNELFPDAPIYTTIYDSCKLPPIFKKMDIKTSFMQKLPFLDKHFKKYLMLYPRAIESFDLKSYDLILSSSSAFAKGAIKSKNACHICYCYSPMRFVWDYKNYVEKENFGRITSKILPLAVKSLKKWDLGTVGRVDYYIAISNYINERIKGFYNRESEVIYPPVDVKNCTLSKNVEDYFLIVSRLNAYKNIDLVIESFNELGLKLKIVGTGPHRQVLEKIVKSKNIEFLGRLNDADLKEVYSRCRAFIFPGREDFGITPVEAQAFGRPVIAYAGGGALETVIEGVTGLFFKQNSREAFISAINEFLKIENSFNSIEIRKNALKFDTEIFKEKIVNFISNKYKG